MVDNVELFQEEIEEIKEFSGLDLELFSEVISYSREVVGKLGSRISPVAVVDVIDGAVSHLICSTEKEPVLVEEAVDRAIANLHLIDEMDEIFADSGDVLEEPVEKNK